MEGWVDLGYPAMHRPGVELAISRSQVRHANHYTTEPPNTGRVVLCVSWASCWDRLRLSMQRSSANLQLYDSDFQTEGSLSTMWTTLRNKLMQISVETETLAGVIDVSSPWQRSKHAYGFRPMTQYRKNRMRRTTAAPTTSPSINTTAIYASL